MMKFSGIRRRSVAIGAVLTMAMAATPVVAESGIQRSISESSQADTVLSRVESGNGAPTIVDVDAGASPEAAAVSTGEVPAATVEAASAASVETVSCDDDPTLVAGATLGTPGDDVLVGTADIDIIFGLGGDDELTGLDGDDILCGGDGDDIINGGDGADEMVGGDGADELNGGNGDDVMSGGNGDDMLNGGRDNDDLSGDAGSDTLVGDKGDDSMFGGDGADQMYGGAGADFLDGENGDDTMNGGGGDDTLLGRAGSDVLNGGAQYDTCDLGDDGLLSKTKCENNRPVANDDTATVLEDGTVSNIPVLVDDTTVDYTTVADTDPDGDTLTVTGATSSNGTATFDATTVSYSPDPDSNGIHSITYSISDGNGGTNTGTVTVTVTPVNDEPSFATLGDQTVDEDSGPHTVAGFATPCRGGGADEAGQTFSYTVSNDNAGCSRSRRRSTRAAADLHARTPTQRHGDGDGVGQRLGRHRQRRRRHLAGPDLRHRGRAVNDEPSFATLGDQTVTRTRAAHGRRLCHAGRGRRRRRGGQTFSYTVSNDNAGLFAVGAGHRRERQLTYTLNSDVNGTATVTVSVSDSGGTANGGDDTSPGPDLRHRGRRGQRRAVVHDAGRSDGRRGFGPHTVAGFATPCRGGGADEAGQTFSYTSATTTPGCSRSAPAIDASGSSPTRSNPNANGTATVTVSVSDSGGTANGGDDTSPGPDLRHRGRRGQRRAVVLDARRRRDVYEDSGPHTVAGLATPWRRAAARRVGSDLAHLHVSNDNAGLFAVAAGDRRRAVAHLHPCHRWQRHGDGQRRRVSDDGGTANGGDDTSDNQMFDITVTPSSHGSIDIEKSTNGFDADAAPGPEITVGTPVSWTYLVTNTGQDTLVNVSVSDDQGVSVSCPQTSLLSTESMSCTAGATAQLDQYQNVGTVTATVAGAGTTVTDSDASHYFGIPVPVPDISIEKSTNGEDADTVGSGPTLSVGATVNWEYAVTNTGDTPLFPISVTDSDGSLTLDCEALDEDGPLLPGETRSCTASGPVLDTSGLPFGDYENTGTATGTPSDAQGAATGAPDVVATDLSHYTGVLTPSDGIDIEKYTEDKNGDLQDADVAPGPTLSVGDTVGWIYIATNTGSTFLTNVAVSDDQGVTVTCFNRPWQSTSTASPHCCPVDRSAAPAAAPSPPGSTRTLATVTADSGVTDSDPSHYFGVVPDFSIDIEKDTNGSDADAAPGPTLSAGDPVTWTYVVTNDGTSDLTGVTVSDNDGSIVVDCSPGIPDPFPAGSSHTCVATGIATVGQYENVGTATGESPTGMVTDSDRSHYFVPLPAGASISIEKSTNGVDADSPNDPDLPEIPQGQQVTWVYEVTNTGGVDLFNVSVTDDQLVGFVCDLTLGSGSSTPFLAPNATAECSATGNAVVTAGLPDGVYANTGTVTAATSSGSQVTASDDSHYRGLGPVTIDIEKATNGVDADFTPITVTVDDPVTWSYVVTNTSDEDLINIVVTDDREGAVTCPQSTLGSGVSMTCTSITDDAVEGLYINVGSVEAQAMDGRGAYDADPSQYVGQPETPVTDVDIEKFTNGHDADTAPGPSLDAGTAVTWSYLVTNTGNTPIGLGSGQVIIVTDDQGEEVFCPPATLAPLESMTCTASGTAAIGLYANVGTVEVRTGNQSGPVVASDSDSSHYTGVGGPRVDIEKSTNGVDADTPATAVGVLIGTAVTWEYVVQNTGAVPLTNVVVIDDQLGTVSCPQSTLGVGAAMTCTANGFAVDTSVLPSGVYANIGTVTADALGAGGPNGRTTVTDSDASHYDNTA